MTRMIRGKNPNYQSHLSTPILKDNPRHKWTHSKLLCASVPPRETLQFLIKKSNLPSSDQFLRFGEGFGKPNLIAATTARTVWLAATFSSHERSDC